MSTADDDIDIRGEYDFSQGVRGKYAERYAKGTNIFVLDDDVAAEFSTSAEVNDVLRRHIAKRRQKAAGA